MTEFSKYKQRASELGYELFLLNHTVSCTLGRWDRENHRVVNCGEEANISVARHNGQKWIMNNICTNHLDGLLAWKPGDNNSWKFSS